MTIVTTLNFAGRTEEALAFYRDVLDAETLFLMRFRESPLIFHATFRIDGSDFMASDVGFIDTGPGETCVQGIG